MFISFNIPACQKRWHKISFKVRVKNTLLLLKVKYEFDFYIIYYEDVFWQLFDV